MLVQITRACPVVMRRLSHGGAPRDHAEFAAVLLLSNAFGASIGGLGTPVGTPPNLIGIGFIRRETGVELTFFS